MKTFYLFFVMFLLLFTFSCGETEKREVEMEDDMEVTQEIPNSDEVIERWNQVWKNNDTAQVRAMTANDAILLLNGKAYSKDSVTTWLKQANSIVKDFNRRSLKTGSTDNILYESGIFNHTYQSDTTVRNAGVYTFIMERSNMENDWKIKVMNISNIQPVEQ